MRASLYLVRLASLAAAALLLAPESAVAQARPVAGTYNTTVATPQGPVKAVIVLKRDNGALGGTIAADGFPVLPATTVTPSDSGVTIQADTPDGGVAVVMKFGAAEQVTGSVVYLGTEMALDGTFVASEATATAGGAMSPTGLYVIRTSEPLMGETVFEAQCTITKSASGAFGGTCGSGDSGEVPASSVTVDGNTVTIGGDTPVGPFRIVLAIVGSQGTGTVAVGAETAKATAVFTAR